LFNLFLFVYIVAVGTRLLLNVYFVVS